MMVKTSLIKILDKIIGTPLTYLLPETKKITSVFPGKIRKILVIRPGGIGDFVLLLPAINAIGENFPDAEIHVLSEKRNSGIAQFSRNIKKVYLYDRGFELFKCLKNKYDTVIDTEQWHSLSAIVAYFTRAPLRIGFGTNKRSKLFTRTIDYSRDDYEAYSFLRLLSPLIEEKITFDENKPFIVIPGTEKTEKTISMFPGASMKERKWPVKKFAEVAKTFARGGYKIIILGSKADRAAAKKIARRAPESVNLAGKTSLEETASVIAKSAAFLSADSGLMHLAYALGTPVVALFGSGIEKKWAPRGKRNIIINKRLPCSPCTKFGYTPRCKHNIECLNLITPEEVISALEKLLG